MNFEESVAYLFEKLGTHKIMALAIKSIPTRTGEDASRFVDEAEKASENAGNLDFSEKIAIVVAVLKKANMM